MKRLIRISLVTSSLSLFLFSSPLLAQMDMKANLILMMADLLTDGIIKQFPGKF